MKYIRTILCILLCACLLTSCKVHTDQYITSSLDVICRGDYTEYSKLTGKTVAELTTEQKRFMEIQTDRLLVALGGEGCSSEMRSRYISFVKMIYSGARYEVTLSDSSEDEAAVKIWPAEILTAHTDEMKAYAEKFRASNEEFAYSSLSSEEYVDQYLDGMLGLLGAYLSDPEYGKPQTITLRAEMNEEGLKQIEPGTMSNILEAMLPVPG
jgi:hypothetical protein